MERWEKDEAQRQQQCCHLGLCQVGKGRGRSMVVAAVSPVLLPAREWVVEKVKVAMSGGWGGCGDTKSSNTAAN